VPLQLASQRRVQTGLNFLGKREESSVTVQLNGFLRGVKHGVTVMALGQVGFEGIFQVRVQFTVQIVRDLVDRILAS
jgi:hypothetical protein